MNNTTPPGLRWWDELHSDAVAGPNVTFDEDWIVVMGRAAGASNPRFHIKNLTTAAAWAHSDGDAPTAADPRSASGGYFKVGAYDVTPGDPGSGNDDYTGTIGLVGFWDGVNMSDGQVEELSTNLQTSDWCGHAVGAPTFLSELTSVSPTDIGSVDFTLVVTGAVATGTNPAGWTFNGCIAPPGPEIAWITA